MGLLSFWVLAHGTTPISSTPPRSGRRPMLRSARRRVQLQQCPAACHAASSALDSPQTAAKHSSRASGVQIECGPIAAARLAVASFPFSNGPLGAAQPTVPC